MKPGRSRSFKSLEIHPAYSLPRPVLDEPSVLIVPRGDKLLYFHVPDECALFVAALNIVQQRFYDSLYGNEPPKPKDPGMTREQVERMPPGSIRESSLRVLSDYEDLIKERAAYDALLDIVNLDDGRAAWEFLRSLSGSRGGNVILVPYAKKYEDFDG